MSLRFSTTRRGTLMRKSNSAPSLLSLVQEGNEDADCDDASFAQELAGFDEGLDWTSIKNQRDDDYKHGSTGLRHVDSMELIETHLHKNGDGKQHPSMRERTKDVVGKTTRACSLPHVDSCELISYVMGHYEEDDLQGVAGSSAEDTPASTGAHFSARIPHMPHISGFRSDLDFFQEAIQGL